MTELEGKTRRFSPEWLRLILLGPLILMSVDASGQITGGGGGPSPGFGGGTLRSFPADGGAGNPGSAAPGPMVPGIRPTPKSVSREPVDRPASPAPAPAPANASSGPAGNLPAAAPNRNTTVITRLPGPVGGTAIDRAKSSTIALTAVLMETGSPIDQGLVWRVFDSKPDKEGKYPLVSTSRESVLQLTLQPGSYMINAAFGRANLTRKIDVKANEARAERFVLNAGGLKVTAVTASDEPISERSASYDIFADERDQFGNRIKVMSRARLGLIVRLNAGIYHIVSTYGDANAIEHGDITVEAGKLTEAAIKHSAARVTLKLVTTAGGEALAGIRWAIATPEGTVIKESLGALPTHILRSGTYVAVAKQGNKSFKREFVVQPGEVKQVEVMLQ